MKIRVATTEDVPQLARLNGTVQRVHAQAAPKLFRGAERIMCRVAPALHDAAVGRTGCQTVVMRGRQYRGYVYVTANALTTKRELNYWIHLALDYNEACAEKA